MHDADGRVAVPEAEWSRLRARLAELESASAAHVQSQIQSQYIVNQLPCVAWTTDLDLKFTSSVGAGLKGLSLRENEVVGRSLFDYFQTSDPTFFPIARAFDALGGKSCQYEYDWMGQCYLVTLEPLRDDAGKIVGSIGVAFDITEQKRAQERLRISELRYRDLFDNANDIIFTQDMEGNFLSINRAAEQILGYSRAEALEKSIKDVLPPEALEQHAEMMRRKLAGEPATTYETTLVKKDGSHIHVEVSTRFRFENGVPVGIQGIARDITDRKILEEHVRQSQKMEAIGVLAGGVAHDFNNLLTGILGHADLLRSTSIPEDEQKEAIATIIRSAERAADLTRQLLGFARRGKNRIAPVDLHNTIEEVTDLLSRTIDKRIRIVNELSAEQSCVPGDSTQLYQVLLNLALNARDAMPEGGIIRFRTWKKRETLILRVEDTGTGISEEARNRIFEPFFTTKEAKKGTGMGLAMAYGIVKNHGGSITVESQPNRGTQFELALPLCATADVGSPSETPAMISRGGRVLIIDDEQIVRGVLLRMLRGLGYEAIEAKDARHAIEFYTEHWPKIDAVILDLNMPQMGGWECFAALREINPNLRAIISSGYGIDSAAEEIIQHRGLLFLQKPYQLAQLATAMQRTLASAAGTAGGGVTSSQAQNRA
jgi:PAS domain S-box-containing protein